MNPQMIQLVLMDHVPIIQQNLGVCGPCLQIHAIRYSYRVIFSIIFDKYYRFSIESNKCLGCVFGYMLSSIHVELNFLYYF